MMSDMCAGIRERIADAMVSGETFSPETDRHLAACHECMQFADALREDDRRLSEFAATAGASIARIEQRVQQALRERTAVPQSRREGIMFKRTMWVAAAAMVVVVAVSAVGYFTGKFGSTTAAWADVQQQIDRAVSVTYVETFETEDIPPFEVQESANADGQLRSVHQSGAVTITDFNRGVTLNLFPRNKTALLRTRTGVSGKKGLFNYVGWIRTLHKESPTFLRKERIDGVQTNVYEVKRSPFETHIIWVNARTDLPVRVETTLKPANKEVVVPSLMLRLGDYGGDTSVARSVSCSNSSGISHAMKITKASFNWNAQLQDSLFSLDAPPGYHVEKRPYDVSHNGADDLAAALRAWVDLSGGPLPVAIEDLGNQDKVPPLLKAKYDRDGKPEDELEQALAVANQLIKGLYFAEEVRLSGDWGYRGNTATVGDSSSVICWWRQKESDPYRAVYGDFRVDEVTAARLERER